MYVLIRKDILTDIQCGVQASHAITEYMRLNKDCPVLNDWAENHRTLIFLAADEQQINMKKRIIKHAGFKEIDLGDIETAVAFKPMTFLDGNEFFGELKLV